MEPLHPDNRPLTALERTVFRFRLVAHEAQITLRGFNKYSDVATAINNELLYGITHHALILVSKFLEVWEDFGALANADSRVVPTRRAMKPLVDRINIWKGFDLFRNSALAHAYLAKDGTLLPPWELQTDGKAPSYHAEIVLLLNVINVAVLAALSVFEAEYTPLDQLLPWGEPSADPGPGIRQGTEIQSELARLVKPMEDSLRSTLGVECSQKLARAFQRATSP